MNIGDERTYRGRVFRFVRTTRDSAGESHDCAVCAARYVGDLLYPTLPVDDPLHRAGSPGHTCANLPELDCGQSANGCFVAVDDIPLLFMKGDLA